MGTRLAGPSLLAMVGGIAAAIAGVVLLATGSPWPIVFGAFALIVAWRILQLSIAVDGDEVVVRNLFHTVRVPREQAEIRGREHDQDIRTRLLPDEAVPKMSDDNTKTAGMAIYLVDTLEPDHFTRVGCSVGLSPAAHAALFFELSNAINSDEVTD